MKLSKLKLNPTNPRIIKDEKFKKLVKSIQEFPEMMEKRPMVCVTDTDGKLYPLGGNMRLKALIELKYKEIPDNWVMLADEWTEEKRNRFTISDNVSFGEWDYDKLANNWDGEDLIEWGVEVPEWEAEAPEAVEDDYEIPDEIETDIVLGDLFEIGEHRLLCGDSTDSDSVAKLMNGEKADMVFTDPPYNFEDDSLYASIIEQFTENAHVFVMHDDKGIVSYLLNSNLEFNRFFVADFKFASPRGNDPYLRHILISHQINGKPITHKNLHDGFSSIIKMNYRKNIKDELLHDHQKDIEFIATFVKHYSDEQNILLDLFLGSGSTMVTSHQLKRKCYGMELDPKYCDVIVRRMLKLDDTLTVKRNGTDVTNQFK